MDIQGVIAFGGDSGLPGLEEHQYISFYAMYVTYVIDESGYLRGTLSFDSLGMVGATQGSQVGRGSGVLERGEIFLGESLLERGEIFLEQGEDLALAYRHWQLLYRCTGGPAVMAPSSSLWRRAPSLRLSVSSLRFSHDTISSSFGRGVHYGQKIGTLVHALQEGTVTPEQIYLQVIEVGPAAGGLFFYFSLNNRRLWALQQYQKDRNTYLRTVFIRASVSICRLWEHPSLLAKYALSATTFTLGVRVQVRGDPWPSQRRPIATPACGNAILTGWGTCVTITPEVLAYSWDFVGPTYDVASASCKLAGSDTGRYRRPPPGLL